jgi:hypothetical protein
MSIRSACVLEHVTALGHVPLDTMSDAIRSERCVMVTAMLVTMRHEPVDIQDEHAGHDHPVPPVSAGPRLPDVVGRHCDRRLGHIDQRRGVCDWKQRVFVGGI